MRHGCKSRSHKFNGFKRHLAVDLAALQSRPADTRQAIAIVTRLGAVPDLQAGHFERPLYVHMAALTTVLGKPQAGGPRDLLDAILDHEQRDWARHLGLESHDGRWRERMEHTRQAAAAVVARGSCAREDLPVVMAALGLPDDDRLRSLLQDLYPDPDPARRRAWVVSIEPDLVAEALLCSVLERRGRPEDIPQRRRRLGEIAQRFGQVIDARRCGDDQDIRRLSSLGLLAPDLALLHHREHSLLRLLLARRHDFYLARQSGPLGLTPEAGSAKAPGSSAAPPCRSAPH